VRNFSAPFMVHSVLLGATATQSGHRQTEQNDNHSRSGFLLHCPLFCFPWRSAVHYVDIVYPGKKIIFSGKVQMPEEEMHVQVGCPEAEFSAPGRLQLSADPSMALCCICPTRAGETPKSRQFPASVISL